MKVKVLQGAICAFLPLLQCSSAYQPLSDEGLLSIPEAGTDFDITNGPILAPILVPRVPNTPSSTAVLQHFVDFFRTSLPDWSIEFQNSSATTPTSKGELVPFKNLILTRDPPGALPGQVGRLALVAHYDTLQEPQGFVGAVDSAAPCAMLMHAARSLDKALSQKWADGGQDQDLEPDQGIQIILLDGEEAFLHWSDTDSIYGARALAEEWEQTFMPAMSTYHTPLSAINLFVLLDLLGSSNPTVPSYFQTTHWAYQAMADLELRLKKLGKFKSTSKNPFLPDADKDDSRFRPSMMGDDHLPFLERGVEILHLIPSPFPVVWHNQRGVPDDGEHLDMDVVEDWTSIITAFAAEWMELDPYLTQNKVSDARKSEL